MSPDTIAVGAFTVIGTLVGLYAERLMRRVGGVWCEIDEDGWYGLGGAYHPEGDIPDERRLRVAFLNHKDLPVTVWKIRVEFYKEGMPLEEWARPDVQFVDDREQTSPLEPVNLPPHVAVPLTLRVLPGREDQLREMEDVDEAVFVATLVGARDERRALNPPWRESPR